MLTTQYKITLPNDYDMDIIRHRVENNGCKTDGFYGLKFKLYLITEKDKNNSFQNSYCPLYIWNDNEGLNKFLFNGFYDNILSSFGWQQVTIDIPLIDKTTNKITEYKYLLELTGKIEPQRSLDNFLNKIEERVSKVQHSEYVVVYNPYNWSYSIFYFIEDLNKVTTSNGTIYEILYISQ